MIRHANKDENNKLLNILILQSLKKPNILKTTDILVLQLKNILISLPIRRYPDLLVHRMIKNILNNSNSDFKQENLEENLSELTSLEKEQNILQAS